MGVQCVPGRGLEPMQTSLACRSPRWPLTAEADPFRPGPGQFRSMATSQVLSVCSSVLGSWLKTAAASPSKESWEEGVEIDSDSLNLALQLKVQDHLGLGKDPCSLQMLSLEPTPNRSSVKSYGKGKADAGVRASPEGPGLHLQALV